VSRDGGARGAPAAGHEAAAEARDAAPAADAVAADPLDETREAERARELETAETLLERYADASHADGPVAARARRVALRALCRSFGDGVHVGVGVRVVHPETFEIGDAVSIGDHSILEGASEGRCVIGPRTTIGPQSYLQCHDLALGASVGWGPGAKVIAAERSGDPVDEPILATELAAKPVRVRDGADIGANAVLLPGVTVGEGAIVAPGAVVTRDVAPFTVVAGVPARVVRSRKRTFV
jgi:acetyltransferase-like isoleucine patch superfamily enzyme